MACDTARLMPKTSAAVPLRVVFTGNHDFTRDELGAVIEADQASGALSPGQVTQEMLERDPLLLSACFALRFRTDQALLPAMTEWIDFERLCCPFLTLDRWD
jgi:hypothetical protein